MTKVTILTNMCYIIIKSFQDSAVTALMSSDTWIGLNDIAVDENFVWVGTNSSPSYTNW